MIRYRCLGRVAAGDRSHLDPDTADRLLRGDTVGAEHRSLATVLTAAAAAGRPAELRGRPAALAAFRAAAMVTVPPQPPSTLRSAVVKLLTVKTALLAALVVGTGGAALAAGAVVSSRPPARPAGAPPVATAPASPSPSTSPTPAAPPTTVTPTPSSAPPAPRSPQAAPTTAAAEPTSPTLETLCRVYKALVIDATPTRDGVDIDISAGLDSPIFQILIIAAGGRAEISAFCTAILNSTSDPDGIGTPPIIGPYGSRGALYSHPWEPTGWPLRRSPH